MNSKSVSAIAGSFPAKPVPMLAVFLFSLEVALPGAGFPQWREITATNSLKMGYQLIAAGLNRDGRPDLSSVDECGTKLAGV